MRKLYLILILCLFSVLAISINACKKDFQVDSVTENVSESTLKRLQEWHNLQVHQKSLKTLSLNNITDSVSVLQPDWDKAKYQLLDNGEKVIAVPGPDFKLSNDNVEFKRIFIFKEDNETIKDGAIVEFYYVKGKIDKSNNLIAKVEQSNIVGFTGARITYDVNYTYQSGVYFQDGNPTNKLTFIGRDKKVDEQGIKDRRITSTLVTNSFEGQTCYNVYWITYEDGNEINRQYLYTYCEGGGAGAGGGGGSGVPVVPPPVGGGGSAGPVENLMNNPYNFTPEQRAKLQSVIDQMISKCVGKAIYDNLKNNNRRFEWQINSNSAAFASYNPSAARITIKDINQLDVPMMQEELFHAVQNFTVPGGTSQYTPPNPGSANIEFESKLMKDINATINGMPNQQAVQGAQSGDYINWLYSITQNGAKLPSVGSVQTQYYYYLNIWKSQQSNNSYNNTTVDPNMPPQTMFNLFNDSTCPKQ